MKVNHAIRTVGLIAFFMLSTFLFAACAFGQGSPRGATLKIGDPAPALGYTTYLKGEPIEKLEKGQMYLLEFWATWCTPCKMIMPHLSEVAEDFKGKVTFISVNVAEQGLDGQPYSAHLPKVRRYMKAAAPAMNFRVLMDDDRQTMQNDWLTASSGGFPAAILVDREGKIAWVGYPGNLLAGLLDLALQNKLTPEALKALEAKDVATRQEEQAFMAQVEALDKEKEYTKAVQLIDERLKSVRRSDQQYPMLQMRKYTLLTHVDRDTSRKAGDEFIADQKRYPVYLSLFAFSFTFGQGFSGGTLGLIDGEMALKVAKMAYKADPESPMMLQDLASAYAILKDASSAIKYQERAIANLPAYGREGQRSLFTSKLDQYRAMAQAGDSSR